MKKLAYVVMVVLTVIYIYIATKDTKIYYLALGDELSLGLTSSLEYNSFVDKTNDFLRANNKLEKTVANFISLNYRTTDLIRDIESNVKVNIDNKEVSINNAIIKADFISISIGMNDFSNYINSNYLLTRNIDNLEEDMDKLLSIVSSISKEKIVLIGIYDPNISNTISYNTIKRINEIYKNIAEKYDIYYLDIYEEMQNSKYINNNYPTVEGYNMIYRKLQSYLESDILN